MIEELNYPCRELLQAEETQILWYCDERDQGYVKVISEFVLDCYIHYGDWYNTVVLISP